LQLTDNVINGAINSISGFLIAKYAQDFAVSLEQSMESFYNSNIYKLLNNKKTGYYFDSIPELFDMFVRERKEYITGTKHAEQKTS
jgi:hypothetical protein